MHRPRVSIYTKVKFKNYLLKYKFLIFSATVGFDAYKHHILVFFTICNKVLSNMNENQFINTDETKKSIQKFFKAIHATPKENLPSRNTKENESQDVE